MGSSVEQAERVWGSEDKVGLCVNCAGLSDRPSGGMRSRLQAVDEEEGWSELRSPL